MILFEEVIPDVVQETGMTETEEIILTNLVEAWNAFCDLESTHPSDVKEFHESIHRCQYIIGMRTLRRLFPDTWMSYKEDE